MAGLLKGSRLLTEDRSFYSPTAEDWRGEKKAFARANRRLEQRRHCANRKRDTGYPRAAVLQVCRGGAAVPSCRRRFLSSVASANRIKEVPTSQVYFGNSENGDGDGDDSYY